jgi:acetoin utilization deacetylase AcuC-like enzyme
MLADAGESVSPSTRKPGLVAEALRASDWRIRFLPPEEMALDALYRVHDPAFVDSILSLSRPNGFGNTSETVARSLRHTCGAFHTGAKLALSAGISASLTSGFHHASTARARGFCTFNGLMASAALLLDGGSARRVAILDCDFHYGDGTTAIIDTMRLQDEVLNVSLGANFGRASSSTGYLDAVRRACVEIESFAPDIVFYQAGVDSHIDDPLGGLLTSDELRTRDEIVFGWVRRIGMPLTWNLAGGYQVEPDGSIPKVVNLHMNTFEVALRSLGLLLPPPA